MAHENALKLYERSLANSGLTSINPFDFKQNKYDVIDLRYNEISELDLNVFASLPRLKMLMLQNNQITKINGFCKINSLSLENNKIMDFESLQFLKNMHDLTHLVLLNNPVNLLPNYRKVVIKLTPQLKYLDYQKITNSERNQTEKTNSVRLELLKRLDQASSLEEVNEIERLLENME